MTLGLIILESTNSIDVALRPLNNNYYCVCRRIIDVGFVALNQFNGGKSFLTLAIEKKNKKTD